MNALFGEEPRTTDTELTRMRLLELLQPGYKAYLPSWQEYPITFPRWTDPYYYNPYTGTQAGVSAWRKMIQ